MEFVVSFSGGQENVAEEAEAVLFLVVVLLGQLLHDLGLMEKGGFTPNLSVKPGPESLVKS